MSNQNRSIAPSPEVSKVSYWHGCYENSWKDLINPEAFAHPAKFSRSLIRKIITYALEQGYLQPGDTILDPFGGVGLGALDATIHGLNWIGIELEARFCDMANGVNCTGISKADWVRFYGRWDRANYKDGRHWCPECLANARLVIDKAPQLSLFEEDDFCASYVRNSGQIPETKPHYYQGNLDRFRSFGATQENVTARLLQGDSRKLIQVLVENGVNDNRAVISSPPYAKTNVGLGDPDSEMKRLQAKADKGELKGESLRLAQKGELNPNTQANLASYGATPGQLANLPEGPRHIITSPPFAGNSGGRGEASREGIDAALFDRHSGGMIGGMGQESDNLGNLRMNDGDFQGVIASPPFAGNSGGRGEASREGIDAVRSASHFDQLSGGKIGGMGQESDNLGNLRMNDGDFQQVVQCDEGEIKAVISSPPFGPGDTRDRRAEQVGYVNETMKRSYTQDNSGTNPANLASLPEGDPAAVISSPPFVESVGSDDPDKRGGLYRDPKRRNDRNLTGTYGQSDGQLGRMAEGEVAVISSPPYEGSFDKGHYDKQARDEREKKSGVKLGGGQINHPRMYGTHPDNIGNDSGDTFWSAARLIVEQCYKVLPQGGHSIWICKDFVRGGKRVEFSRMWTELCESVGFTHLESHRALLVKDNGTQIDLNGNEVKKTKAHKSFFRRLAESKGSPKIDWEDVIIMRKD